MNKLMYCLAFILLMNLNSSAQNSQLADGVKKIALPVVYLPENVSVHFISPEPIRYVDISTKNITGDLPLKNVLRIKQTGDTTKKHFSSSAPEDAVITIAGEKYIAQYRVVFADAVTARDTRTDIEILPAQTRPLDISGIGFSQNQLKNMALNLFCREAGREKEHAKAFGINGALYHIYSAGDYIFLDLGFKNKTQVKYDIDEFRFKIDDKKVTKASNVQSVEIKPDFILFDTPIFKKCYRNIYVFKKISFPGNKVLHIELSEKQLSGRVITLTVSYQDVLDADIIPAR
jgi:conjugative transposon TraN protein